MTPLEAERFCRTHLFCPKTHLFYEHLVDLEKDGASRHLPSPALIRTGIPCGTGWSTGMEDSVLCGSRMLDAYLARFQKTGSDDDAAFAREIWQGLRLCASVSDEPGFIARSVSPADGVSHYPDSSRDQYTHFVFSASAYYDSPLATEDDKAFIRKTFAAVADRMARTVTPENDYQFPREDGAAGIVFRMWGKIGKHEYDRLPMMYLAAARYTGEAKYEALYRQCVAEALEKSKGYDYAHAAAAYPAMQMQYALLYLYEHDDDPTVRAACRALMEKAAAAYRKRAYMWFDELSAPAVKETLNARFKPWHEEPAVFGGVFGGYAYYNHNAFGARMPFWRKATDVADAAVTVCLVYGQDKALADLVDEALALFDANDHYSNAPLYLFHAHTLLS